MLFAMISVLPDVPVDAAPSSSLFRISVLSPNTDTNDGNEASSACELICIGILDDRVTDNLRFVDEEDRGSGCTIVRCPKSESGPSSGPSSKQRGVVEDVIWLYDLLRDIWLAFCLQVEVAIVSLQNGQDKSS